MIKFLKFLFVLIFILGAGLFAMYSIIVIIDDDLEFGDSFALFGGGIERGYGSAGFLISYEPTGGFKTCGFSALGPTLGVTAGHCLDNTTSLRVGSGDFTLDEDQTIEVIRGIQKAGWADNQERANDFSIVIYNAPDGYFSQYANIDSPSVGCDYRVVAYGRTEDGNSAERPRKSAKMCFYQVDDQVVLMRADASNDAGICFGDSGSPVFREDTNELVGVVASIINSSSTDPNSPCSFNNEAIVVRTDFNEGLIDQNLILAETLAAEDTSANQTLQIDTAEESFLDRIGIGSLAETELWRLAIYASGTAILFIFFAVLVVIYRD